MFYCGFLIKMKKYNTRHMKHIESPGSGFFDNAFKYHF